MCILEKLYNIDIRDKVHLHIAVPKYKKKTHYLDINIQKI